MFCGKLRLEVEVNKNYPEEKPTCFNDNSVASFLG